MKKALALVIALVLLAAIAPMASAASTVYITVSIDGKLEVIAEPVTVSDMTLDSAFKAAHEQLYQDGVAGYEGAEDPMWKFFVISKFWGVTTNPYIVINNEAYGADKAKGFADTYKINDGDNIIVIMAKDVASAKSISMAATVSGSQATVTALQWTMDQTFTYISAPYANAAALDKAGNSLGTTDKNGTATVQIPADGIICIEGLAAIRVSGSSEPVPSPEPAPAPAPAKATAVPSPQKVTVNGADVAFDAYNINGSNFFKLRDLAKALDGSAKQFEVSWDGEKNAITLTSGKAYTPDGSELKAGDGTNKEALSSTAKVYLDGEELSLTAYNINGNNFFKLRDLGQAIDFGVDYDAATNTVSIDTSKGYTA